MVTRATAKAAGRTFEREVAELLSTVFPFAERRRMSGRFDKGDVTGLGGEWVVECKATRTIDLAGALDEARVEQTNARARWHVAVIKRRNKSVGQAYAVMTLDQLSEIMRILANQPEGD